jgi:hypothetical protein
MVSNSSTIEMVRVNFPRGSRRDVADVVSSSGAWIAVKLPYDGCYSRSFIGPEAIGAFPSSPCGFAKVLAGY